MLRSLTAASFGVTLRWMINEASDYQVRLAVFEGPLDLLLHLVQKREVDVTAVSLASVADQFLEYLSDLEENDPETIIGFLVVAAKLLVLKSWALLPSATSTSEEEEIVQDLTKALVEYQLYKRAADELRTREESDTRSYPRVAKPAIVSEPVLEAISAHELAAALLRFMREDATEEARIPLPSRIYTVEEKVDAIQKHLRRSTKISFKAVLQEAASRLEIIVTFLAVLELLKRGQIGIEQETLYAEIYLTPLEVK